MTGEENILDTWEHLTRLLDHVPTNLLGSEVVHLNPEEPPYYYILNVLSQEGVPRVMSERLKELSALSLKLSDLIEKYHGTKPK